MKREIPDILIEQLALDELDPRVKRELVKDSEVLRRLENLKASNAEILETYSPAETAKRIEGRLQVMRQAEESVAKTSGADVEGERAVRRAGKVRRAVVGLAQSRAFFPALAAAAAIALVIGFLPLLTSGGMSPNESSGVRVKGAGPVLHVYRETKNGVELLKAGASASAHDLLQLSYIAAGAQYGMIFSIDGSGTVTLHFPERSRTAARLESGGEVALPYSYELDNAPRFERFYLVTSQKEFSVDEILSIARKAATSGALSSTALPRGFKVASFTVDKETTR
jgi:hypothetical protein